MAIDPTSSAGISHVVTNEVIAIIAGGAAGNHTVTGIEKRDRIKRVDQLVVICGEHTVTASGVSTEITIAQEENKSYFLLHGRANKQVKKPKAAKSSDKIYDWTWPNLKTLI